MRLATLLCLLAAAALAGPKRNGYRAAQRALASGRPVVEGRHVADHASVLRGSPGWILPLCRFAADCSVAFQATERRGTGVGDFDGMCDRLASLAKGAGPWAEAEIGILRARVRAKPDAVRAAVARIAAQKEPEARRRAVEYLLQLGDAEGLAKLRAAATDEETKEAAQAAELLLAGDVDAGLKLCRKKDHLLRRYNDFVSLDRARGKKTKYRMVDRTDWFGAVSYELPLSRHWVALDYHEWGGGAKADLYRCDERGDLRAVVDVAWFQAGKQFPVLMAPKKADGRDPEKLAEALMAYDLQRLVRMPTVGPKRARGMRKVRKAYWYEIWSVQPRVKRVRQWVCSAGGDSYGIRVDYRAETSSEIHPEITEFLRTFRIEKR